MHIHKEIVTENGIIMVWSQSPVSEDKSHIQQ